MKYVIIGYMLLSLAWPAQLQAQARMSDERIESMRIAFYTQRLNLTSKEAAKFWPVYNEYSEGQKILKRNRQQKQQQLRRGMATSSDKELEQLMEDMLKIQEEEAALNRKYYGEFKKILPVRKVVVLFKAEQDFRQKLLEEVRRRQQERMKRRQELRND